MKKIILMVCIGLILFLVGSASFWLSYFPEPYQWLNPTLFIVGCVALILALVRLWFFKRRTPESKSQHELELLIKKDNQLIADIFKASINKIKGSGSTKLDTLYDLPWYVLIGGGKDAKSSILQQNNLEPVLSNQAQQEEQQEYLTFWSNEHVVVIEVGHRLFDNEELDDGLWKTFSQQLLSYRPRQALSGILSVIGCDRLLKGDRKEQQRLSTVIQEAALTLSHNIGVKLPVYSLFSKADSIADFIEFFESFPVSTLDQPFGITFENNKGKPFAPDEFEQQIDALLASLSAQQLELLDSISSDKASSVMALPYQLKVFLDLVKNLLSSIGKENRVRESVWLRGAYLLSSGQKGSSFDLLSQAVAEKSEFNTAIVKKQSPSRRSFFVASLFSKVILPEYNIVGVNKDRQLSYLLLISIAIIAVAALLSVAGIKLRDNWNADEAWRAKTTTQLSVYSNDMTNLIEEKESLSIPDLAAVLFELRTVAIEGTETKSWYDKVSVKQQDTSSAVYAAYEEQLNLILLPKIEELISNELYVYISLGNPSKIFNILRFYQMLFDDKRLSIEDMQDYLLTNLEDQGHVSQDDIDKLAFLIEDLFQSNYDHSLKANQELIAVAINNLEGVSAERLIYSRLKSLSQFNSQVDIRRQLGENFAHVFEFPHGYHGFLIPEIFTKQGYSKLDLSAKSTILRTQLREFNRMRGDFSSVSIADLTELSKKIQRLYFADYIYRWKDMIKNIHVKQFNTTAEFSQALKLAREPVSSPILDVLEAVALNTTLAIEEQPDTKQQKQIASQLGLKSVRNIAKKADRINRLAGDKLLRLQPSFVVNEAFKSYASYVDSGEDGSAAAPVDELFSQFDRLNNYFEHALTSSTPDKIIYQYAVAHANGSQDEITTFAQQASAAPDHVATWIRTLTQQAWANVIDSAQTHISKEWQSRVYQFYGKAIAERFPFAPNSRSEISLNDFTAFFKSQGVLDSFIDEVLTPFVYWERDKLILREIEGKKLPIDPSVLTKIAYSKKIQQLFFNESGQELGLNIRARPNAMSTDITQFSMSDEQVVFDYRHGPRVWNDLQWPSKTEDTALSLSFYRGQDRVANKSYTGKWSLLRLVLDSKLSTTNVRNVTRVRYQDKGQHIDIDISIGNGDIRLNKALFTQFRLPAKL